MALAQWQDLCFDSDHPAGVAPFWAAVLGLEVRDAGGTDPALHRPTPEEGVWINTVPEPKTVKNRWHWDVVCDDVPALIECGAALLREPKGQVYWHVLADPEGNEFCAFAA